MNIIEEYIFFSGFRMLIRHKYSDLIILVMVTAAFSMLLAVSSFG